MENRGGLNNETEKKKKKINHHVIRQKAGKRGSSKSVVRRNKNKKKKLLIKRVYDYLTSDSYMYAPLLAPHPATAGSHLLTTTTGPLDYIKRVTSRILTRPRIEKDRQARDLEHQQAISDDHPEKLLEEQDDKAINVNQPEADVHDVGREQTIGHFEIAKCFMHQRDLLLSSPGHCVDNPKDFILTHKSSKEIGCST